MVALLSSREKLLQAALHLIRYQGYNDTTVDDLCRAAGVTKGSFFHHFSSKDDLALAAITYWNETTGQLFAAAPYHQLADPRDRLLAYLDFRESLLSGEPAQFTCLLGAIAQESFATHPTLRDACHAGITSHADTLTPTVAAALAQYAPTHTASAASLALYFQAVLQGAFILAKSQHSAAPVKEALAHLRQYLKLLFPKP